MSAPLIDAVILAAGRSRRMGVQKLLLPFAGQTVIGHIVDQVAAPPVRRAVVVTGAGDDSVRAALAQKPVHIAENPNPDAEMLSSVRVGLRALPPDTTAALIVLGDQPSLRRDAIEPIVVAFQRTGKGIIAPIYDGQRGHPLLIHSQYFEEVLTQHDSVGLRGLLTSNAGDVFELPVADPGVVADMDHPADYQRELADYLRRQSGA